MVGLCPNDESSPVANARTVKVLPLGSITYRTFVASGVPTVDNRYSPSTCREHFSGPAVLHGAQFQVAIQIRQRQAGQVADSQLTQVTFRDGIGQNQARPKNHERHTAEHEQCVSVTEASISVLHCVSFFDVSKSGT